MFPLFKEGAPLIAPYGAGLKLSKKAGSAVRPCRTEGNMQDERNRKWGFANGAFGALLNVFLIALYKHSF